MKTPIHGLRIPAVLAAILVATLPAAAELILWSADILPNPNTVDGGLTPADFAYATLSIDGGDTYLHIYGDTGDTGYERVYATTAGASGATTEAVYSGVIDPASSGDLLVQFWDDSDSLIGSQSYAISTIASHLWSTSGPALGGGSPLRVQYIIPEPASGALLLVGAAMLFLGGHRRGTDKNAFSKPA